MHGRCGNRDIRPVRLGLGGAPANRTCADRQIADRPAIPTRHATASRRGIMSSASASPSPTHRCGSLSAVRWHRVSPAPASSTGCT